MKSMLRKVRSFIRFLYEFLFIFFFLSKIFLNFYFVALLDYAEKNINSYRRDLLLANDLVKSENKHFTVLYNKWARHSLPTAINTIDTVLFQNYLRSDAFRITAINHPIKSVNVVSNFLFLLLCHYHKVYPLIRVEFCFFDLLIIMNCELNYSVHFVVKTRGSVRYQY